MRTTMTALPGWLERLLRAPADAGGSGAGGGGDGGESGGEGAGESGAGDEGAGGQGGAPGEDPGGESGRDDDGGEESGKPWYERDGVLTAEEKAWISAKGYNQDMDEALLVRALRAHRAAETKIGKPADALMDRPGKDQPVADWMKANREIFGLPEDPDGYEIQRPELPEGVSWDEGLEAKFRQIAHDSGMTPTQVQANVDMFAEMRTAEFQGVAAELQSATDEMRQQLERDWGDQYAAKVRQAQQAAAAMGEKAGLDSEQILSIAQLMKPKIGDAGIMKLFATIGEAMGDDAFVPSGGGAGVGMTPQEAKAEHDRFVGSDGEYGKAYAKGDQAAIRRLNDKRLQLLRLSSGT